MFTSNTIVDRIEIDSNGSISVRFLKQVSSSDNIISSEPHRVSFMLDENFATVIGTVSNHLEALGFTAIKAKDENKIKQYSELTKKLMSDQ